MVRNDANIITCLCIKNEAGHIFRFPVKQLRQNKNNLSADPRKYLLLENSSVTQGNQPPWKLTALSSRLILRPSPCCVY